MNVDPGASVASIITRTRTLPGEFRSNFVTINLRGLISGGLTVAAVQSGGNFNSPQLTTSLNVDATGALRGATAIRLDGTAATNGSALLSVVNSGIIQSTSGPAILSTNPATEGVTSLNNRAGATLGAVHAVVGSLVNAGMIDGGTLSAVRYLPGSSSVVFPSSFLNSGLITANSTLGTVQFDGPFFSTPTITNRGTIRNTGSGVAVAATQTNASLVITNEAGAVVATTGAVALRASGQIALTNNGTVTGGLAGSSVTITNRGQIDGSIVVTPIVGFPISSRIDNSGGGVINGNVTLADTDDFVTVDYGSAAQPMAGINGTIDARGGIDTIQFNFANDTILSAAVARPATFERTAFGVALGRTLTLNPGFTSAGTVDLGTAPGTGDTRGRVINRATINTSETFIRSLFGSFTDFSNEAMITATVAPSAFAIDYSGGAFSNSGTITGNVGGGVRLGSIAASSNTGTIIADGTALAGGAPSFTNSGRIQSRTGTGVIFSGSFSDTFSNTGTIFGATAGASVSGTLLVNSGTITGSSGPGVNLGFAGRLDNRAGGVIGGVGLGVGFDQRFGYTSGARIDNAGIINGNVDFGNWQFGPVATNNVFYARAGGVVNGDLFLGMGGDTFVTSLVNTGPGQFAGVTGTVSGLGTQTLRYIVDADATAALRLPAPFTNFIYDLSNNAALTLTAGATPLPGVQFAGTGSVVLNANLTATALTGALVNMGRESLQNLTATTVVPTRLSLVSNGILSGTSSQQFGSSAIVLLNEASSFTNAGTITVRQIGQNQFLPLAAISGAGNITNAGMITVDGAIGINPLASFLGTANPTAIVNTGSIVQASGASLSGRGIVGTGPIINSGTIVTGGDAIAFTSSGSRVNSVTNSGRISSTTGRGIAFDTSGFSSAPIRVTNMATGTISGATTAIVLGTSSVVDNAGTIIGNVALGGTNFDPFGSAYIARGGTLTGNLTFGSGNDTLIVFGPSGGISGGIEGGSGSDTFLQAFSQSTSTALAPLPTSFERTGAGAIGASTTITVTGATPTPGFAPIYFGDGTIVNRVAVAAGPSLGATNSVQLGLTSNLINPPEALNFVNEAALGGGVAGVARAFSNTASIGQSTLAGPAIALTTSIASSSFAWDNAAGATITSAATVSQFGFSSPTVQISSSFGTNPPPLLADSTFNNAGTISNGFTASLLARNLTFTNSGTIGATASSGFGSPRSVQIEAYLPSTPTGTAPTANDTFRFTSTGSLTGDVVLTAYAQTVSAVNRAQLRGGLIVGQFGPDYGVALASALVENSGTIDLPATLYGGPAISYSGNVQTLSVVNSGTIILSQQPTDTFPAVRTAVAANNDALTAIGSTFTNSGRIETSVRGGSGVAMSTLAGNYSPPPGTTPATARATLNADNTGSIQANGGAIIVPTNLVFGSGQFANTLFPVAGLFAAASGTGGAPVAIGNAQGATIEAYGNAVQAVRAPNGTFTYAPAAGRTAGFGSTAVMALGDQVTITNAGMIRGGAGGAIEPSLGIALDTPLGSDQAVLFPDNYLAGAIQTFLSTDLLTNSATGRIIGSIDLGAGDDRIVNLGTITGDVFLRSGADSFTQAATASFTGLADGGSGLDALVIDTTGGTGATFDLGRFVNFETLTLTGTGSVGLSGALGYATVNLAGGGVTIAANTQLSTFNPVTITGSGANERVVNNGRVAGQILLTGGDDSITNAGVLAGVVDLGAGNDQFALRSGSSNIGVGGGTGSDALILQLNSPETAPDRIDLAAFTGFETLAQTGGTSALAGTTTRFDSIDVTGGRMIGLAGSALAATTINVARGATFGSAGSVTGVINVAGTLSPGASPGTLMVNGNVALGSTSTTLFEIGAGVIDRLNVTGSVVIASGATLTLTSDGTRPTGPAQDLITATGGIGGRFSTVNIAPSVAGFLFQQNDRLQLLSQVVVDPASTPQQSASINYFNAVLGGQGGATALANAAPALLNAQGSANAAAFARTTPESYASATQLGVASALSTALAGRGASFATAPSSGGLFTFGQYLGDQTLIAGDGGRGTADVRINNLGLLGGLGHSNGTLAVGVFGGYRDSRQTIGALAARTSGGGFALGTHVRVTSGPWHVAGTLAVEQLALETSRAVPGAPMSATSRYDLTTYFGDVQVGYRFALDDGWTLRPAVGFTAGSTVRQGFVEGGGSAFALNVARSRTGWSFVDGDVTLSSDTAKALQSFVSLGLRWQLGGRLPLATGGYGGGANTLAAYGAERAPLLGTATIGASYRFGKGATIFATTRADFGQGDRQIKSDVGLRLKF